MKEGMTRIVGAGQYGLDGRCRWPVLGKEPLVLQVEDGVEVFLTVAEALGMDAVARDKLYAWLADRAAQKVWRQAADTRGEGPKRV